MKFFGFLVLNYAFWHADKEMFSTGIALIVSALSVEQIEVMMNRVIIRKGGAE
jgi:hypothetical protein